VAFEELPTRQFVSRELGRSKQIFAAIYAGHPTDAVRESKLESQPPEACVRVYRAFLVDRQGNLVGPPQVLDCADDDAAVDEAQRLVNRCNVEVWDRERFIAFIGPNGVKVRH
jgi:hypothetical protein